MQLNATEHVLIDIGFVGGVFMNRSFGRWLLVLVSMVIGVLASAMADSNARIVRLSDVQGDVKIDRATGSGPSK